MSKIDLSTLPAQELRQLLDSARQRGHAAQSYEILREMDARRAGAAAPLLKPSRRRRRREPRLIELQLGDPLDRPDPAFEDPEFELSDEDRPLTIGPIESAPPPAAPAHATRQRWGHWAALCFAIGLGAGVAAGWWAAWGGSWQAPAPLAVASAAQSAARPPLPVTVAEPSPAPLAPPAIADAQLATAADTPGVPAPSQPAAAASADTSGAVVSSTAAVEAHANPPAPQDSAVIASSEEKACREEATPADEAICAEPRLRALQAELRRAYAQALEAHQDRALLRQRQLAWRDGRNAISNPDQLAHLYLRRIEQLKSATAQAIRER